jgi:hypothetical protein
MLFFPAKILGYSDPDLVNSLVDKSLKMPEETVSSNKSCKILFRFYSNFLEKWTAETLWATAVDLEKGWYRLDNIPFYVKSVACDNIWDWRVKLCILFG